MSTNSPILRSSQAETTSSSDLRDESSEQQDTSTSISPLVTGNDTAAADHHPAPETSLTYFNSQDRARIDVVDSSEAVGGSTQHPVVDVAPVASVAVASPATHATATATAIATVAPVNNIVPPTTVAPTTGESTPPPEMRTASLPPPIELSGVALSITLLLISGVRHQFTMDEVYLEQHSVKTQSGKESLKDPLEMSVGQLKECIWKDWRDEWDQRPASAMFIRLIHFGRMLEDKNPLKDCRLNQDTPNVVHMTVRPPEVGDDEMTQRSTKGFGHSRDTGSGGSTPSCRCVIL